MGDQPEAIRALVSGLENGLDEQVLRGVTGSGKTFTMASVIERVQRPTLVIAPNKTLANKKVVTIGKKTVTSTTLRNLVKNKTYYLRMRTFLTVAGKRYYSAWGLIKSVLVKK